MEAAEARFAEQGDYLLRIQDWHRATLATLRASEAAITIFTHSKTDAMDPLQVRNIASRRLSTLDELRGIEGTSARRIAFNRADSQLSRSDPWFAEQANLLGLELWYGLARVGMEAEDAGADSALVQLRREQPERLGQIRALHLDLTNQLNAITTRKVEVMGSLYDLYDRYAYWLGNAEMDSTEVAAERARVGSRMARLDRDLTVPSVLSAAVTTTNKGYLSETTVQVEASHPTDVYEYLFSDVPGSGSGPTGLRSAGPWGLASRTSLIPSRGTTSQLRTVRSAARGGAGYLGHATTTYTVNYQGGGGGPNAQTTVHMNSDHSPPTAPRVEVKSGEEWIDASGTTAWMTDASRLEVRWSASVDMQSGIAGYEYAIRGRSDTTRDVDWTSVGGRTSIALHGRDLPRGNFYIHVRARNGAGINSAEGRSAQLKYDNTPPQIAAAGFSVVDAASAPAIIRPSVHELNAAAIAACALPAPSFMHQPAASYQAPKSQRSPGVRQAPFITLKPPAAVAAESRIVQYHWRVDRGEPASLELGDDWHTADFQPGGFSASPKDIRIEGGTLDFEHDFTISAVAVNGAGVPSKPMIHRFRIADPTPPTAMHFCVTQHSAPGQLQLAFSSAARDPESGIRGYQYRLRGEDGTIVRDWADSLNVVDFESISAGQSLVLAPVPLTNGARYYADVRAVNGQGATQYVTSGPLLIDSSPPPTPSATVVRVLDYTPPAPSTEPVDPEKSLIDGGIAGRLTLLNRVRLEVQIVAPDDPESGLGVQQWEVRPYFDPSQIQLGSGSQTVTQQAASGTSGSGGSTFVRAYGVIPGAQAGSYTVLLTSDEMRQLDGAEPGSKFELRIRTINGAGLSSAVYKTTFRLPGEETREGGEKSDKEADPRGRRL
jgi:hypothetical protein